MKIRYLFPSFLVALLLAGCGGGNESTADSSSGAQAQSGPRTIEITAGDNMKFNVSRIEARPGEEITVVLTNIGSQPKEVMGHNWVLLKIGSDVEAFDRAAATAKDTEYIPAAMQDQVIAHTALLGPRKSDEVKFNAPETLGEYPFICSFPGHYQIGMKGVLVVR